MRINKKALLRDTLSSLGLTSALWRFLPSRLYCFNFHRVGNPDSTDYSRNVFSCTEQRFEEHVAMLKDKFQIVDLDFLSRQGSRRESDRPLALITFDDGYVDNYRVAYPILRHGVPAVFFIPTNYVNSVQLPWWEEIPWILRQSSGRSITLHGADEPFELRANDGERSIRLVMTREISPRTR